MSRCLIVSFVLALFSAASGDAFAKKPHEPKQTAISCASPNNRLEFSVYSLDLAEAEISARRPKVYQVSGYNHSNAFNSEPIVVGTQGESHKYILTYGADVNGSMAIHRTTLGKGARTGDESDILLSGMDSEHPSERAALYDHIRFQPSSSMQSQATMAFISTKEPNEHSDVGWTALYVGKAFDPSGLGIQRLSPRHTLHADYSPAWSPNGQWIAVARGAGKPGGTNISIYKYPRVSHMPEEPLFVVENGGWPAWSGDNTIIFHRNTGTDIWDRWDLHSVDLTFSAGGNSLVNVSEPTTILRGGLTPYVAPFSPETLLFAFFDYQGFRQIGVMNLTSTEKKQLTFEETHHYNPSYFNQFGNNNVFFHKQRCDSLTPNLRRSISGSSIIHDMCGIHGDFPSISPDGTQISFTSMHDRNEGGFSAIDVMNVDGSNRTQIYNATQTWMTSWVKGNRIAATMGAGFQPADDASVQVITLNSDGSDVKQITNSTHQNQGYPCWSRNGTKMVYRTNVGMHASDWTGSHGFPGPYHLQTMDADGSNKKNLTMPGQTQSDNYNLGDTHPHWGPNGTIIFASDRGHPKRLTIWIINEDGTNMTEVFDDGAMNVHPAFTSDGRHMVFTSSLAGFSTEQISWPHVFWPKAELFTANLDGTNVERVTHDFAQNANVWVGTQQLPEVLSNEGLATRCTYTDAHDPPGQDVPNNHHNHSAYHGSGSGTGDEVAGAERKAHGEVPSVEALMIYNQEKAEREQRPGAIPAETSGRPFPHGSEDVERKKRQARFLGLKPDDFIKGGKKRSGGGCPFLSRLGGGGH